MNEERVFELMDRIHVLSAQARCLTNPERPLIVRLWHSRRALLMLQEAEALLEEIARITNQPIPEKKRGRFHLGRKGWQRLQFFGGVANALTMLLHIEAGQYIPAGISAICVLICALWVIPRK